MESLGFESQHLSPWHTGLHTEKRPPSLLYPVPSSQPPPTPPLSLSINLPSSLPLTLPPTRAHPIRSRRPPAHARAFAQPPRPPSLDLGCPRPGRPCSPCRLVTYARVRCPWSVCAALPLPLGCPSVSLGHPAPVPPLQSLCPWAAPPPPWATPLQPQTRSRGHVLALCPGPAVSSGAGPPQGHAHELCLRGHNKF